MAQPPTSPASPPSEESQGSAKQATGTLWAGLPPRSSRRLTKGRLWTYKILAVPLNWLVHALWASDRVASVTMTPAARELLERSEPIIPCFWHDRLAWGLRFLFRHTPGQHRWCLLVSPSVDGELVAQVMRSWNVRIVRGSATRTGGKAIRDLYRVGKREGLSLVILPDGPHGPARQAKPGAVMLSQLSGAPILPISYSASPCLRLKSWDRLMIPLPFARITIAVGDPLTVPRDLASADIEPMTKKLEAALDEVTLVSEGTTR